MGDALGEVATSSGSNESLSGLERRARRTSIEKHAIKIPARQEDTRMVRVRTFMAAGAIKNSAWRRNLRGFAENPSVFYLMS